MKNLNEINWLLNSFDEVEQWADSRELSFSEAWEILKQAKTLDEAHAIWEG